jgi:hypothetical protein
MAFKPTRTKRPAPHHRKRTGSHHRQNDKYLRHYWPYIPMLLVVGFGLVLNSLWSGTGGVLGAQSNLTASALAAATNQERSLHHEGALALNNKLNAAAAAKAQDMVTKNYWSHDSPSGETPWQFIVASGYDYNQAGENLAYGFSNADNVLDAWMHSPEHRANVLDTDYSDVGFGVAQSPNFMGHGPETVIVAMYGTPVGFGVTATVPAHDVMGEQATPVAISRVQTLTATSSLAVGITFGAAVTALLVLLLRHGRAWHRVLVKSEAFVLHHPLLDVAFVAIATSAILLSQSVAFIL